jgi:6-phosphogluconate dehydrogenase
MATHSIGIVGCGTMGRNLALNFAEHGERVAVFDALRRTQAEFLQGEAAGRQIAAAETLAGLAAMLERPRRILLLVPAADLAPCLVALQPLLETGDILIDGGNSEYAATEQRVQRFEAASLWYVGAGISGGAEGARHGPAIMPGGSEAAWPRIKSMLEKVAARAPDGTPCCAWMGPGGAGHFVKMVHNGIEYAVMQAIAEAYHLMKAILGFSANRLSDVFARWNEGPLASYLLEITREVLAYPDDDGQPLVDRVLDVAEQKGTGTWITRAALECGAPLPVIAEAVFARGLSKLKDQRVVAAGVLPGPQIGTVGTVGDEFLRDLEAALHATMIVAYAQGFQLLRAKGEKWSLDLPRIAGIWRAGCIIRAALLTPTQAALTADPELSNLLVAPALVPALHATQPGWRRTVVRAVESGVPIPVLSSALAFYDGYRCARLPADLIQALRDCFGSHQYERTDREPGRKFHTDWSRPPKPGAVPAQK